MTRPREERRREYRERPSRYRPSRDSQLRRYSNYPPPSRRELEEEFYEEERELDYRYDERPMPTRHYEPRRLSSRQRYGEDRYYENHRRRERLPPPPRSYSPERRSSIEQAYPLQQAKKSTNRKMFLFVYNLFFYTLTIGILLSSVMFAFSEKSDAAIFGYRFYQVLTDSMAPQPDSPSKGFYAGDIVLVKMTDSSQVKEGDIVTFQVGDGDRYLTHRMVERLTELNGQPGDYIVTKGDANNSKDPPIAADRVYGKVRFIIPKMGSVLNFVQENLWLCLVCVLSTFGFFLVLKAYFLQPEPVKQNRYPRGV